MPYTALILATILSYTWFFAPRLPNDAIIMPAAVVLGLTLMHAARTGEWGLRFRALAPGLRAAAWFTVPAVGALVAAGAIAGTLHDRRDVLGELGSLVVWGGAQEWVLQTLVLREAQRATSRRWGVLLAAALFASVHLPNPFLAAMTFVGGVGWCLIYDRHPNILPLALSHALATLAILYAFNDAMTGRLRIGLAYLHSSR
jgi:membrane protease YdiL (CAAX protease family)